MKSIEQMPAQQSFDSGNAPAPKWVRWLQTVVAWLNLSGTYTPTITAGTGAFTRVSAAGRYWKVGSFVFFQITVTITTNGSAAGKVIASLPFTSANVAEVKYAMSGIENNNAFALIGVVPPNVSQLSVWKYDGSYPGADGDKLYISGFYEAAN